MDRNAFDAYVESGGKVDINDWMPEEYRDQASRIVAFQALAEVVGSLMYAEWLPRVPDYERKMMIVAKLQDEIGHGHVLFRVCEDLGRSRESIIDDYLAGRAKVLNIFHYNIESYCELSIASLLQNSAAIAQMTSLANGSFLPYTRALRKIMKEESFHYHQAIDLLAVTLERGTSEHRAMVGYGLNKWFPLVLAYFGPNDKSSTHSQQTMRWRLKVDSNNSLRQKWLDQIIPIIRLFGLHIDDTKLSKDRETGLWSYTEPDWQEVKRVINGQGPKSEYWKQLFEKTYVFNQWIRDLAHTEAVS